MKLFSFGVILLGTVFYVIDSQLVVLDYHFRNNSRKSARNTFSANNSSQSDANDNRQFDANDNRQLGADDNSQLGADDNSQLGVNENSQLGVNENSQLGVNENSQLGAKVLKEIHIKAKNISRSKGSIIKVDGKNPEYRRSLIRKIHLKTNSLALKKILGILETCTDEDMVSTLESLKLLVHEYDTAIDFMNIGGMELIIRLVQMENENITLSTLSVLSAAMQGNPAVQKLVLESYIINILLANLPSKGENYLSSLLFMVSSYLRNMPEAQIRFFQDGGISFLVDIIESPHSNKLRLHSITILADLASEIMEDSNINYLKMVLIKLFIRGVTASHVCKEITNILYGEENKHSSETSEYLIYEKIIHAMSALHAICAREFKSKQVQRIIEKLILKYDPHVTLFWSKIDNELKMSIHLDLKKFHEKMYKQEQLIKYEL